MSDRKIIIQISPLGETKVEAEGFTGGSCAEATRGIEQALAGGNTAERTLKAEYYEEGDENNDQQINVGW